MTEDPVARRRVAGAWVSGARAGISAEIADVRAGNLRTVSADGRTIFGPPEEFRADTGESGDRLLELLLPWPSVSALFHGCAREALASAHTVAVIGLEETRAWDQAV